jgi:hypothetical protein
VNRVIPDETRGGRTRLPLFRAGRTLAATLLVVLGTALSAAASLADGDPASDYLLTQNVSFPYQSPSSAVSADLGRSVDDVYLHGNRVKVALIYTADDLGSIPSLFGKPTDYARFLGTELGLWYIGPLLVVMPSGFGIYEGGRSTADAAQVLQSIPVSAQSPDDLARSATVALNALTAAHALSLPDVRAPLVSAYPASAIRGKPAALRFGVFDDSGRSSALVRVYENGSLLATLSSRTAFKIGTRAVRMRWQVPATLRSRQLRFCVVASDPAGNRSAPACAPFLNVR